MQAGKLRHRIVLKSPVKTRNAMGEEEIPSWSTDSTVWGKVRPLSGSELEHAQQISAEINHKIKIRYNSTVTVEDRVIFDLRTFEIMAIINKEERNIEQLLLCKEVIT